VEQLFIAAAIHQSSFSSKQLFIKAAFHQSGFSSKQFSSNLHISGSFIE
jgi:hypothetical protein